VIVGEGCWLAAEASSTRWRDGLRPASDPCTHFGSGYGEVGLHLTVSESLLGVRLRSLRELRRDISP